MRRLLTSVAPLALALTLAACGKRAAQQADTGGMMNGDTMPMKDGMTAGPEATAKTATGSGVVTAIDKAAGTVTIQHGPIAAIEWPAMTMAFKAEPPALLDTVKVGDRVAFDLKGAGSSYTVTALRAQ